MTSYFTLDLAMGQIPHSTERIATLLVIDIYVEVVSSVRQHSVESVLTTKYTVLLLSLIVCILVADMLH